jgi:hypothetical protein
MDEKEMLKTVCAVVVLGMIGVWSGCSSSDDGSSSGSSGSSGTDGDSGTSGGEACDSGVDPSAASVCTSGTKWTRGDRGSSQMHPGGTCITCHAKSFGPDDFSFAGTVFPSVHEPDDCNGANGPKTELTVVITDATGAEVKAAVNSVGNFYSTTPIKAPFTARLVDSAGAERAMCVSQTTTDCNTCHTVNGANDAPGRIVAP